MKIINQVKIGLLNKKTISTLIGTLVLFFAFQNCSSGGSGGSAPTTPTAGQGTETPTDPPVDIPTNPGDEEEPELPAATIRQNFYYTGAVQTFTVPDKMKSALIKVWGGGAGGYTQTEFAVSPGEQLQVYVGKRNGTYDGSKMWGYTTSGASTGFGGASSSAVLYKNQVVAISGASGAGADSGNGQGGAAGEDSPTGGGLSGFNGGLGVSGGGDQHDGIGGDASPPSSGRTQCGGGGGGYVGGGGGGCQGGASGGGGGSSYISSSLTLGSSVIAYGSGNTAGNTDDPDRGPDGRVVVIFSESVLAPVTTRVPNIATSKTVKSFLVNQAIAPIQYKNIGGAFSLCQVAPALPAGLQLNATTCEMSGTPTAKQSATFYKVTAVNAGGLASQLLKIEIK